MEKIGQAKTIRRRVYFVRGKGFNYFFDFTPWNGGYLHITGGPGGVMLSENVMGDVRSGEVFRIS